jgi:hypothetical protein
VTAAQLDAALAIARAAVLAAPDPNGALVRLLRHVRREREFSASPASLTVDQVAAARGTGANLQAFAASPRR